MFHLLLKFRKALLDGEEPLEAISLWVGLYLLEDHFHRRFYDLKMTSEFPYDVIKSSLKDNKLKVLILQYLSTVQIAAIFRNFTSQPKLKLHLAHVLKYLHYFSCLCISLVEHPHGGDTVDLDIVLVNTSELLNEIVNESLGWFLVRVQDETLVRKTDQLDVLHLEDVAVGGGTREQSRVSGGKS